VIENEAQRVAALDWLSYWSKNVSSGDQSWLAGEQARVEIMRLQGTVNEYDERTTRPAAPSHG
jgi:hypothetical protein